MKWSVTEIRFYTSTAPFYHVLAIQRKRPTLNPSMTLTLTLLQRFKLDSAINSKQDTPKNMMTIWSLAGKIALTKDEETMYLRKMAPNPVYPQGTTFLDDSAVSNPIITPIELESAEARALNDILSGLQVSAADRVWLPAVLKQLKDVE
jgi:hypothetical protein